MSRFIEPVFLIPVRWEQVDAGMKRRAREISRQARGVDMELKPSLEPSDYVFSIHVDPSLVATPVVVLTRREYWQAKKFLQDTSGPTGPDGVAKMIGLAYYRLMDSTFGVPPTWRNDLKGLKTFMESKGFEWTPEMSTKFGKTPIT